MNSLSLSPRSHPFTVLPEEAGWSINYDERDTFSCTRVLPRVLRKGEVPQEALEGLEQRDRCLLGLEEWPETEQSLRKPLG